MSPVPIHAGVNLPMDLGVAVPVLGLGVLVFGLVVLDVVRREVGLWQ